MYVCTYVWKKQNDCNIINAKKNPVSIIILGQDFANKLYYTSNGIYPITIQPVFY